MGSQENTSIELTEQITPEEQGKLYSLLFGQGDFKPTGNMCRLVVNYIRQEEDLSPMQLLEKQGLSKRNWYYWVHDYKGFTIWWNRVIEDVIRDEHLSGLYLRLMKRARTHDTGAAKLIMQRFDPKYTERSTQDSTHTFQGYEPAGSSRSEARQRKALEGTDKTLQDGSGSTNALPPIPDIPPAEIGTEPPHTSIQSTIQAQVERTQAHIEHGTGAGNETMPVIEQETQAGPGEGVCEGGDS